MRAWLFQDHRQKQKLGDKAPWSVGWIDPDGKRRSERVGSKSMAEKLARKREGELAAGVYQAKVRTTWQEFRAKYERDIGGTMKPETLRCTVDAMKHFERIMNPAKVSGIVTQSIDAYVARRSLERGLLPGSVVSKATVNKELRHLKAVLRVAHEWGYLATVPKVRMLKENKKLLGYVTPEHFAAIYSACDSATHPSDLACDPGDWWRALLTFAYMTGWRISEILALRKDDIDWTAGTALTRAEDNKGGRDDVIPLQPVVRDHLKIVIGFGPMAFTWNLNRRQLWVQFGEIQAAAGIGTHYGFHDLRRAFATLNAERLTGDSLQALMRHKSYQTTQRYIAVARQLNRAVDDLYVPDVLKGGTAVG